MAQKVRDMLGVTQIQPLLVLAEAREALSVPELGRRMVAITGRAPYQDGALQTMMTRLEADGLVTSETVVWHERSNGRPPRVFQLTPAGLARLSQTIGQFRKLVTVADRVQELANAA